MRFKRKCQTPGSSKWRWIIFVYSRGSVEYRSQKLWKMGFWTDMLFKSYPHTNHKAIIFVKLRVSMWIIRRKNFFNFSLLPVARLNCYEMFLGNCKFACNFRKAVLYSRVWHLWNQKVATNPVVMLAVATFSVEPICAIFSLLLFWYFLLCSAWLILK